MPAKAARVCATTRSSVWPASRSSQRFADGDDRRQALRERGVHFQVDAAIGFVAVRAPLRMSEDDVRDAELAAASAR